MEELFAVDVQDNLPRHLGDGGEVAFPAPQPRLGGRVADVVVDGHHVGHHVHDEPHLHIRDVHHDDAGLVVVGALLLAELEAHVDDGGHLAPEVDDPLVVNGQAGDLGDGLGADDLRNVQKFDAVAGVVDGCGL